MEDSDKDQLVTYYVDTIQDSRCHKKEV